MSMSLSTLVSDVPFSAQQGLALLGVWLVAFLAPALWVARDAKRRAFRAAPWVALTLVASLLGVVAYFESVAIEKRRAARANRPR
ncbi:MAG: hypothetical protein ACYDCK_13445 [Thermoplasmatota archaeon]